MWLEMKVKGLALEPLSNMPATSIRPRSPARSSADGRTRRPASAVG
jgi:hypothetical protein